MKLLERLQKIKTLSERGSDWEDFHFGNGLTAFDFLNDPSKK